MQEQSDGLAAASQAAAAEAIEHAQRLLVVTDAKGSLDEIVQRWSNTGNGPFAGRFFEWQQQTTFNMEAAGTGSPLRAYLTEHGTPWSAPNPHAPGDLQIGDPGGDLLREAQLKAVASTSQRVQDLAQDKYDGMDLLTPSDHTASAQELLERRIEQANPDFLKHDQYTSTQERLTDRIDVAGVQSRPIDSEELRNAAEDPDRYHDAMASREQAGIAQSETARDELHRAALMADLQGIGAAAAIGGVTAAGITAIISAVRTGAAVRAGTMTPSAAATTIMADSGKALAAGAFVAGTGQAIRVLGQHGAIPEALGGGTLPFAIARASLALGSSGVRYARGELTGPQAAADSAEAMARVSVIWAFSLIGQTAIPIPVVGAAIGGTVGTLCASTAAQGLTVMTAMAKDARAEEELLAALEVEIAAAVLVLQEEQRVLREISKEFDIAFTQRIIPALDQLEASLDSGHVQQTIEHTSTIITAFGGTPLFTSMAEFDAFMRSDEPLVLGGTPGRRARGR